ncbi:MAG: Dolichyl-phosphate-mannose-protein mannosyltransferase [Actinomycetia bacterium]|nr:Dolichyl-phosphate-mannose-protein mannosyltransferase [Actinomycetes bacterium]
MTLTSDAPSRGSVPGAAIAPRRSPYLVAAVAIAVAIGAVLCFYTKSDLWLDEALSVNVARLPLSDLFHWLRHDGAPPLYYILLHFWTSIFGTSAEAVRSLSGVCAIGAAVAAYYAGRRVSGPATGWVAVLLFVSNPFVARFATETRMYMLEIALVMCGYLAFMRCLERPSIDRLGVFALIVALSIYNQYWAFYLAIVVGGMLVWMSWRGAYRDTARRMLLAMAVGGATFIPWLPTFLYQAKHTGTPWGLKQLPPVPIGKTFSDFAGSTEHEGWVLFFFTIALLLVGLFGAAIDERRIEMDLHTRPAARWIAFTLGVGLALGMSLNYLSGGAFQTRYSSYVFPFWLLLLAHGFTSFADRRVRVWLLAFMVCVGFIGGVRNSVTNRTEAGKVAAVLRADAKPGDLVVYCPDQLGPGVHRLAPSGLHEFSYPSSPKPGVLVDWVDYKKRIAASDPVRFAKDVLSQAGDRTIWFVSAPGYRTHVGRCETMSATFAQQRRLTERVISDETIFEMPGLQQFSVR